MTYKELFESLSVDKKEEKSLRKDQIDIGKKIEEEHKPTYQYIKDYFKENGDFPPEKEVYKRIAADHLIEFEDYYTRLVKMEKEAKKQLK